MNAIDRAEDAFLTIHYEDRRNRLETWRIYRNDGEVHIYDGKAWRVDYRLTPDDMAQARAALERCGVLAAENIGAEGVYDTATLTWEWELPNGRRGTLTNRAHPAKTHPAMDCVMDVLLDIEERYLDDE